MMEYSNLAATSYVALNATKHSTEKFDSGTIYDNDIAPIYCTNVLKGTGTNKRLSVGQVPAHDNTIIDIYQPVEHVIICEFADGKKEKAVCMPGDTFDLETGISVCLAKHALGGASNYYKAIKQGVRVAKEQEAHKVEEARLEEIKKKRIERAKRRKDAYKARKREERIAEMAEAQVRAQKIYEAERFANLANSVRDVLD